MLVRAFLNLIQFFDTRMSNPKSRKLGTVVKRMKLYNELIANVI